MCRIIGLLGITVTCLLAVFLGGPAAAAVIIVPWHGSAYDSDTSGFYGVPYIDLKPGPFKLNLDVKVTQVSLDRGPFRSIGAHFRVPQWTSAEDVELDDITLQEARVRHPPPNVPPALLAQIGYGPVDDVGVYRFVVTGKATGSKGGWLQAYTRIDVDPLPAGGIFLGTGLSALLAFSTGVKRRAWTPPLLAGA